MKTIKKVLIIIISLELLTLSLIFFLMIYSPGAGLYVYAEKIQNQPENYVEISLLELKKYPYVREAVMNPGKHIKIPIESQKEFSEFTKIFSLNKTQNIKVDNEYFKINGYWAD